MLKPVLQNAKDEVESYAKLTNYAMRYLENVLKDKGLVNKLHFIHNISKTLGQIIENLYSASNKASNTSQTIEESKTQNENIHKTIKKLIKDIEYKK